MFFVLPIGNYGFHEELIVSLRYTGNSVEISVPEDDEYFLVWVVLARVVLDIDQTISTTDSLDHVIESDTTSREEINIFFLIVSKIVLHMTYFIQKPSKINTLFCDKNPTLLLLTHLDSLYIEVQCHGRLLEE